MNKVDSYSSQVEKDSTILQMSTEPFEEFLLLAAV